MPIPFLVAGAVAAGVLGIGGHMSAKETNERAESISRDAKRMYDDAKESLETAQENTEGALLKLGYSKKDILASSMKKFVQNYAKVQEVSVRRSIGLNELSNFTIDKQEVLQKTAKTPQTCHRTSRASLQLHCNNRHSVPYLTPKNTDKSR